MLKTPTDSSANSIAKLVIRSRDLYVCNLRGWEKGKNSGIQRQWREKQKQQYRVWGDNEIIIALIKEEDEQGRRTGWVQSISLGGQLQATLMYPS